MMIDVSLQFCEKVFAPFPEFPESFIKGKKNCPLNVITGCDTVGRSKVCVISGNNSNFALEEFHPTERKPNQEGGNICSQYCIKSVHAIKYCIVCKSAKKKKKK